MLNKYHLVSLRFILTSKKYANNLELRKGKKKNQYKN